jgi:hypothetical protein
MERPLAAIKRHGTDRSYFEAKGWRHLFRREQMRLAHRFKP